MHYQKEQKKKNKKKSDIVWKAFRERIELALTKLQEEKLERLQIIQKLKEEIKKKSWAELCQTQFKLMLARPAVA